MDQFYNFETQYTLLFPIICDSFSIIFLVQCIFSNSFLQFWLYSIHLFLQQKSLYGLIAPWNKAITFSLFVVTLLWYCHILMWISALRVHYSLRKALFVSIVIIDYYTNYRVPGHIPWWHQMEGNLLLIIIIVVVVLILVLILICVAIYIVCRRKRSQMKCKLSSYNIYLIYHIIGDLHGILEREAKYLRSFLYRIDNFYYIYLNTRN